MKHQLQQIREALESADEYQAENYHDYEGPRLAIAKARTALSELEAMVGEQEPCGWFESPYGAFRGNPLLNITFPASTLTWQIPAFIAAPPARQPHRRHLLNLLARIHGDGGHYTAEHGLEKSVSDADQKVADLHLKAWEAQQQYEAGDMASAHNDGFRAGVASVAQQPPEIEVQCPVCNHKFYEWPNDKQPQAEAVLVVDRVYEAAKRLVDHADFQLGGVLSAKSKTRDIPSNAASKVKARHLASLRDALAKTPHQAEAVPGDVTDAMVDAYLKANDAYWRETDTQPKSPTKWRNGNPKEATRVSLAAAIAQQKGQP